MADDFHVKLALTHIKKKEGVIYKGKKNVKLCDRSDLSSDGSGYNAGYYCLYGYLNRTSDNKVCIMEQRKGTGNIYFSTSTHSTNKSDGYTVGSFYARGIEEMLSVK